MAVDLSQLPPPDIIEVIDFETILARRKAFFVGLHPVEEQAAVAALLELESEPIVKYMEENTYRELLLRIRYNDEARALLLAYATGTNLDHVGVTYYQLERLVITPADPEATPPVAAVFELDDAYRYRCSLKPESFSVAGPTQAFEFHALSASGQVKSVKVDSPTPGTTRVYVLSTVGSGIPDSGLIDTVFNALNTENVRPLSEAVIVEPATVIEYAIEYQLTMYPGATSEAALSASIAALQSLANDAHRLAYDLTESQLDAAAQKQGIKRAVRILPESEIVCGNGEAPYCTGITVTIAGIEE